MNNKKYLSIDINIQMEMKEGETKEQALERFETQLFFGICYPEDNKNYQVTCVYDSDARIVDNIGNEIKEEN